MVVVVVVVNGLSRALHKLCWNVIQDCCEEGKGERGKLFSYKFSAISSQRGSEHLHFSPRVGVRLCWLMMDCPSLCSSFSSSPENKKRREKRPQKSSSFGSSSVTRKFVTAFSALQTAFPAVSLFQLFEKGDRQIERRK